IWAKEFENVNFLGIEVDANGNLYSTGGFYSITDFDPGPGTFNLTAFGYNGTSTGIQDVFVLKLDAAGNFQWVKQMGGTQMDQAWGISLDPSGNILTTGHFEGTVDFDPGSGTYNLVSVGSLDAFISKLDPNGNFIWAKQVGGTLIDYSR